MRTRYSRSVWRGFELFFRPWDVQFSMIKSVSFGIVVTLLDDFSVTAAFRSTICELHTARRISATQGRELRQEANAAFRRDWGDGNGASRCASDGEAAAAWLRELLERD